MEDPEPVTQPSHPFPVVFQPSILQPERKQKRHWREGQMCRRGAGMLWMQTTID